MKRWPVRRAGLSGTAEATIPAIHGLRRGSDWGEGLAAPLWTPGLTPPG